MSDTPRPKVHADDSVSCPHCGARPLRTRFYALSQPFLAEFRSNDAGGLGFARVGDAPEGPKWALTACDACGGRVSVYEPDFLG